VPERARSNSASPWSELTTSAISPSPSRVRACASMASIARSTFAAAFA
jgi:hypothetical protein